ncbi:MAG: sulfite exporter TauE/SafE family protein [Chloroflexi bacterium]|nr:sulfite exporter TauE/SafE family protein [Chloroflexota bacterium]
MREFAVNWYVLMSTVNAAVAEPLRTLGDGIGVPLLSALIFGLIGATAPCQLTTNAGALAYVAREAGGSGWRVAHRALAYVAGKALVYTVLGVGVIVAGRELLPVAAIVAVRKALGPLMVALGLYLLGLLRLHFSVGRGAAEWLEARAGGGTGGAFLLGAAFSLAFCPTLFLLFFGLTIPLAVGSPVGLAYPGLFALGTALPLLAISALLAAGVGALQGMLAGTRRVDRWLRPAAGVVLLLAGINDTITYWFL